MGLPHRREREQMLQHLTRHLHLGPHVNLSLLADITSGYREADLETLCRSALTIAKRQQRMEVTQADFERAIDKLVLDGIYPVLPDADERRQVAYHLAGQALVARHAPALGSLQQVSLLSPASPLKAAESRSKKAHNTNPTALLAHLDMLLGGVVAEELVSAHRTSYAEQAVRKAAHLAWQFTRRQHAHNGRLSTTLERDSQELLIRRHQVVQTLVATFHEPLEQLATLLMKEEVADSQALGRILGPGVPARQDIPTASQTV